MALHATSNKKEKESGLGSLSIHRQNTTKISHVITLAKPVLLKKYKKGY